MNGVHNDRAARVCRPHRAQQDERIGLRHGENRPGILQVGDALPEVRRRRPVGTRDGAAIERVADEDVVDVQPGHLHPALAGAEPVRDEPSTCDVKLAQLGDVRSPVGKRQQDARDVWAQDPVRQVARLQRVPPSLGLVEPVHVEDRVPGPGRAVCVPVRHLEEALLVGIRLAQAKKLAGHGKLGDLDVGRSQLPQSLLQLPCTRQGFQNGPGYCVLLGGPFQAFGCLLLLEPLVVLVGLDGPDST